MGVSTGTVHRALHDRPGVSPITRARVLEVAKTMGYRPNLAARYLSSKRSFRVSVNTLQGTTSFWDEVRAGIAQEAREVLLENVEVEYRTYPRLGQGEQEAFEAALSAKVDGVIVFPSRAPATRTLMRRASRNNIPVVCVSSDAPDTGKLAVVSSDTLASGSLAADLMGKFLNGTGKVAVTLSSLAIAEHADKYRAFHDTLLTLYPGMSVEEPIEDHDVESEAYEQCRRLFQAHPDLAGVYVTTEASIPVLNAARDACMLDKITIITTDLFPDLVQEIRRGAVVATLYQRPGTQGRMAFRVLHEFLVEGECRSRQVTLTPHLVMRGNLEYFLQSQAGELAAATGEKGFPEPELKQGLG